MGLRPVLMRAPTESYGPISDKNSYFSKFYGPKNIFLGQHILVNDSGLERKAATQVREFEKLAFAYFALVSLTFVHKIQKNAPGMAPGISGSP